MRLNKMIKRLNTYPNKPFYNKSNNLNFKILNIALP